MKTADLRKMKDDELVKHINELAAEGMKLRFQQATMQLTKTARPSRVRQEIARVKTILAERNRGAGNG